MKKLFIGSIAAVALSGLAAAAIGGTSWLDATGLRGEKRLVQSRVTSYWDARVDGDFDRMVAYVHPNQGSVPEPGMLVTEGYQLHELALDGDRAVARLTVKSRLKHPVLSAREREVEIQSAWVKYEGKWYVDVTPSNIYDAIKAYQSKSTPPTAKTPSTVDETTSVQ